MEQAITGKTRYRYMDAARGLALLLVMISHAHGLSPFLIYYYIQVFFVISGFIYRPGVSYGDTMKKKVKRLLVPYFGYSALLWCFYAIIRRDGTLGRSLFGVFYSRFCLYKTTTLTENVYLLDIANGAMWYLTAFFMACAVFYLVADRCVKSLRAMAVTTVILLAATMLLNELPVLLPWSADLAGMAALLMLTGAYLRKYDFFERRWSALAAALLFAGTLAVYVGTVILNGSLNTSIREYGRFDSFSVPLYFIISVTGSVLCIWVSKWLSALRVGTFLSYLGNHTIELMCLHMVGLEIFEIIARRFLDPAALNGAAEWIYAAVRVCAAIAGALAAGRVIDWLKAGWGRIRQAGQMRKGER